jgi:dTMP kinase
MSDTYRGKFITFEGIDGCGKSTQAKMLYDHLKQKGIDVILTREPGGTEVGEKIREILLDNELAYGTEFSLIMAARFEHVFKVIYPALTENKWIICDRFIDSTAAYQGGSFPCSIFGSYESFFFAIYPDITFFINVSPEECIKRIQKRYINNKFDTKFSDYDLIYTNYLVLANKFKERIKTIDGTGTIEEVHNAIIDQLALAKFDQ